MWSTILPEPLPKQITLAKNLPKFEENYKYLQSYCANSTEKMYEKMNARDQEFEQRFNNVFGARQKMLYVQSAGELY
ncbi:Uncharacterised protein [Escherichia coli]|nr:Uncharacterised protein [Escherichia coli]